MDANQVAGKALYLEFRKDTSTYQVIVTPDGISKEGRYVPASIYRRQISESKPRKAWKVQTLPAIGLDSFGAFTRLSPEQAHEKSLLRLEYIYSTFSRLRDYGFALYKSPIIVETATEDMSDIAQSKTPYKVLGRITRVRRTLGFGESLFATKS